MKRFGLLLLSPIVTAGLVLGESSLSPDLRAKVDQAAEEALADTGVPSASVAVVKDGKLAYLHRIAVLGLTLKK
jgi:CubicO group peptidase (beta-lactamase class C family)